MPQQKYWPVRELRNPPEGQKKPERRYYVIGERELEAWRWKGGKKLYHAQFIANDGANIGHFQDGIREDDRKNLHLYTYRNEKRYDAERLEQAIRIYNERINGYHQEFKNAVCQGAHQYYTNTIPKKLPVYSLQLNNCQDYITSILSIYDELEDWKINDQH